MAKLVFRVQANYEEVIKLRNEIEKLKKELKGMDVTSAPAAFNTLNTRLSVSTQRMDELVTEAAKAGAEMEGDFKKKIFDASQVVNGLSEKITLQRGTIQQLKNDLSSLKDKYREALKQDGNTSELETQIKEVSAKLRVQKDTLFGLTQEQANARLSVKKLRDEYALYRKEGGENVDVTKQMEAAMLNMGKKILGGIGIKQLISDMIRVRGEFQAADTAIQTLLGSKEKADVLMSKVREYAKISPLEFSDVTQATQMMLGFNIEAEKVPRFLQAIGDVSMGDTQNFNSLTLAFSQMSAAGKLMGQDLNQMINAGFNPLQQMAQTTGKSITQLRDEMSNGAISAEMVQQAFIDATSAGGKFYQMSENASKTINGQLSMMQDAIDVAFNELGQKSEGVIMKGIQMTKSLIENYETVGKVLVGLVSTYGVYRTAVMLTTTVQGLQAAGISALTAKEIIHLGWIKATTVAQKALNAAMLTNPYVLLATAVVGLGTAMWALHDSTTAAEAAQKSLNETAERAKKKEEEHKQAIENLISVSNDENLSSKERQDAMNKLIQRYPSIIQKYIDEEGHLRDILKLKQEIAELDGKQKTANLQKDYENDKTRLDFLKKLKGMNVNERSEYLYKKGNENLLQWYKSMQKDALKSYNGRSALTFSDMLDFYTKRTEGKKAAYNRNVTENKIDQFSQGLSDMSTDELKSLQKELERANKNRKASTSVFVKSVGDYLTGTDRENLLTKVSGMISSRRKSTYKQDYEKAKKDWEEAKKELSEIEKDKSKFTSKQYEDAKKRKETAEKVYKDLGGVVSTSSTKSVGETQEKDKRLDAENKANESLIKLQQENRQAQLDLEEDTAEKKLKLIDLSYDKQKAEIAKKERELAEQNKKADTKGLNEKGLTVEQQTEINKANEINEKSREKQISDIYKAELQSMRDYLKEYGTYQQQKLAIAQEYAEKIAKAQNEGERLTLEKQRNKALRDKADEQVISKVDWIAAFGNLGTAFESVIKDTLAELDAYIQTDDFRSRSAEDKKTILDAQKNLQGNVSNDATFARLNRQIEEYRVNVQTLSMAEKVHLSAINDLTAAEQLRDSITDKNSKEYADASKKVAEAQKEVERTAELVTTANNTVAESQGRVSSTAVQLQGNLEKMSQGINQLTSGTLAGTVSGLENLIKGLGGSTAAIDKFKDLLKTGLSAVFGEQVGGLMSESLDIVEGVLTGDMTEAVVSGVLGMVDNILEGILKGGIITKPVNALLDGLRGIGNTLTFGGLNSWLDTSNAKEVAKTTERLTNANERLKTSIDGLKDEISNSVGVNSINSAREALNAQEKYIENQREILNVQQGYHGSHHSNKYYWNLDKATQEQINSLLAEYASKNNLQATTVDRNWSSFAKLSPEEMDYLRKHDAELWEKLTNIGKYDKSKYFDAFADLAGSMEEITDSLKEVLTTTTADNVFDDFLNSLYDLADGSEDVFDDIAESWQNMVNRMAVNNLVGANFQQKLKLWYDELAKLNEERTNSRITNEEYKKRLAALKDEYDRYVQSAKSDIDTLREEGIIQNVDSKSTSQSSTRGVFETMSQDTATELNGRFTALQIAGEEIKAQNIVQSQSLNILTMRTDNIISLQTETRNIADDTRSIIANSYLELQEIRENTGAIVKPIIQMQKDIAEVKQNTSRL